MRTVIALLLLAAACVAETADDRWMRDQIAVGRKIELESREYRFELPWNLRQRSGLVIIGHGRATTCRWVALPTMVDACVDAAGAARHTFRDFTVVADPAARAAFGFLFARSVPQGNSAGEHALDNIEIRGPFSAAAIGGYGSEENVFERVAIYQSSPSGWCYHTAYNAPIAATSLGVLGGGSNVLHTFRDCHFGHYAVGAPGLIHVGDGTVWIIIQGGGGSLKSAGAPGSAAIVLHGRPNALVQMIQVHGWEAETDLATHSLRIAGHVRGLEYEGNLSRAVGSPIVVEANAVLWDSIIRRNYLLSTNRDPAIDIYGQVNGFSVLQAERGLVNNTGVYHIAQRRTAVIDPAAKLVCGDGRLWREP